MLMPYTPITGVLVYIWDRAADAVLMVHRIARDDDEHLGKYNGLGGKLEADEDIVSAVRREVREEASIELSGLSLRGTISWPGFGANGEDWLGFIFLADRWTGTPARENDEGPLEWIPRARLFDGSLPMWEGDIHFLPLVFDDDPRAFHGVMPYIAGRPARWDFERL
jgi:8-oxo-dGTP diphosphatase